MNAIQSQTATLNYRPDIDGLRGIAILGVVLYHAGVPLFSGGFAGVDIFFVISGYLIGGHIFSEVSSGNFSFLRFYQRRAKRILPAFFLVIAFTLFVAIILLSPFEIYIFAKSAMASILSVSNIYFAVNSNYFQTANDLKPLLMTWSLSVEEQFYAVIPLLLLSLARIRRSLLLPAVLVVCALSFLCALRDLNSFPSMAFYSLPARAWELGAGVVLAIGELGWMHKSLAPYRSQVISLVGLALMVTPIFLLTSAVPFPGAAAVPSVIGTAMIIASPTSWINRRLISFSPLTFIGKISYSWYLWHWPLLAFLRIASGRALPPATAALAIALSLTAAIISYYFIEQPFRRSSGLPAPLLRRYAVLGLLFFAVFAALRASHGLPKRYPALIHDGPAISDSCTADYGIDKPLLSSRCYAASDPRPSVVLWGDSHSSVLAPTLRALANAQGYNFIQLSKSSCLPLDGAAIFLPQHPLAARECIHFNHEVLKLVESDHRIRVVIMAGRWADPFHAGNFYPLVSDSAYESKTRSANSIRSMFVGSLLASIRPLQSTGRHVIVFDDVPNFDFDPLLRYRTSLIPARHTLAIWMGVDKDPLGLAPASFISAANISTQLLRQTIEGLSGVELVDLKSSLCDSHNLCAYMNGNRLFYADEHHLTTDGAQYTLRHFHFPSM